MRTTININDDLFEIVRSTAHQNRKGIGATIQALIERGLSQPGETFEPATYELDELTGFPLIASKCPVTIEDVRSLEDNA